MDWPSDDRPMRPVRPAVLIAVALLAALLGLIVPVLVAAQPVPVERRAAAPPDMLALHSSAPIAPGTSTNRAVASHAVPAPSYGSKRCTAAMSEAGFGRGAATSLTREPKLRFYRACVLSVRALNVGFAEALLLMRPTTTGRGVTADLPNSTPETCHPNR